MSARSEVLGNRTIHGEKPLCLTWGLELLHVPFPLPCGLVRVLIAVIEIAVLSVFHPRQDLPLGGPIAFEFIRDEHPWDVLTSLEEFAEKLLRRLLVPATLHENIEHEHVAVLVDRPSEIMALAVDGQKHFVQMPFIARSGAPATQLIGVCLAKLPAPLANRFRIR
jgi:hypothetical protein